jgi:hypothetical protein
MSTADTDAPPPAPKPVVTVTFRVRVGGGAGYGRDSIEYATLEEACAGILEMTSGDKQAVVLGAFGPGGKIYDLSWQAHLTLRETAQPGS